MNTTRSLARQEWKRSWRLVAAAAIAFSFTSMMTIASGVFMLPLGNEFGWSRTLLSSGPSIASITTFLFSPLFGVVIDRIGTRRLALPGLVLMALTIMSLSLLDGSALMWFAIWTVYAVAALATKSTVWTAAVASAFDTSRGLALGLTLSGSALAQSIAPPLANLLINELGWRMAFLWLGAGWGSLAAGLCLFWLFDGYDASRRERAANPDLRRASGGPLLDVPGLAVAEAWRSPALWRIALSTFIILAVTIGLMVHQIPILVELGITRTTASIYAGLAGLAGIPGKLVTGYLLDRYSARWVGSLTLASASLTFVLLLLPHQLPPIILLAMLINGYAAGTSLQIAGYLTTAYGGMRHFGAIFGVQASLMAAGGALGPLIGGMIYDRYGSYEFFLIFGIGGTLISALLLSGLCDYPSWHNRPYDKRTKAA